MYYNLYLLCSKYHKNCLKIVNDTNANKATVFCKYRNSEYQADKNNVQTQKHQRICFIKAENQKSVNCKFS